VNGRLTALPDSDRRPDSPWLRVTATRPHVLIVIESLATAFLFLRPVSPPHTLAARRRFVILIGSRNPVCKVSSRFIRP